MKPNLFQLRTQINTPFRVFKKGILFISHRVLYRK